MNIRLSAFAAMAALAMSLGGPTSASAAGPAAAAADIGLDRQNAATSPIIDVRTTCDRWGCGPGAEDRQRDRIDGYFGHGSRSYRRDGRREVRRDRYRQNHYRDYRRGGPSFHLHIEPAPRYRPRYHAPSAPSYSLPAAHVRWCHNRYRSYRTWDNSFQPYNGPRRQCRSPYFS